VEQDAELGVVDGRRRLDERVQDHVDFAMQKAARLLPDGGRLINVSRGATTVGFAG
jgi:hypothetical protein